LNRGSAAPAKAPHQGAIFAAAMVAVVFFALTAPLTRAITPAFDPLLLGMRPAPAALAAVPLILILRLKGPSGAHEWLLLAVSAAFSFLAFPLLFSLGQARTSAIHGGLIQASMPIFTGLTVAIVERRRPGGFWWLGAALAFAGEGVLVLFRDSGPERIASLSGDLLILAASALSAGAYVAGARLAARITALNATMWCVGAAGLAVMPFAAFRAISVPWSSFDLGMWASLITLSYGPMLLAFIAWFWALAKGGVRRVAVFQFLVPPLSVLISVVFLGERLTPPLIVAMAAIFGGIWLARRGGPQASAAEQQKLEPRS
jgi:drug/metabolite transporter (DMT)-like permease